MLRYIHTIILLFLFKLAFACTCVPIYNNKGELVQQKVDLIIKATVVRIDTIYTIPEYFVKNNIKDSSGIYRYFANIRVSLIVHKSYQGQNVSKRLTLITGQGGGDCGYHFKLNKQYVIYGNYEEFYLFSNSDLSADITKVAYLTTNVCTKTTGDVKQAEAKLTASRQRRKF